MEFHPKFIQKYFFKQIYFETPVLQFFYTSYNLFFLVSFSPYCDFTPVTAERYYFILLPVSFYHHFHTNDR